MQVISEGKENNLVKSNLESELNVSLSLNQIERQMPLFLSQHPPQKVLSNYQDGINDQRFGVLKQKTMELDKNVEFQNNILRNNSQNNWTLTNGTTN